MMMDCQTPDLSANAWRQVPHIMVSRDDATRNPRAWMRHCVAEPLENKDDEAPTRCKKMYCTLPTVKWRWRCAPSWPSWRQPLYNSPPSRPTSPTRWREPCFHVHRRKGGTRNNWHIQACSCAELDFWPCQQFSPACLCNNPVCALIPLSAARELRSHHQNHQEPSAPPLPTQSEHPVIRA